MAGLTADQVAELTLDLKNLTEEIECLLLSNVENSRPVELDQPIGRLTRMDAIQQQHMAAATRQNHTQRLKQVALALSAVEDGSYGECRNCEEPISFSRLKARPETPFCLDCQSEFERSRD